MYGIIAVLMMLEYVSAYVVSITNECPIIIEPYLYLRPGNDTYLWITDDMNLTSICNYTMERITYASYDLIEIYGVILSFVLAISGTVITCMFCYIVTFWIERRSRHARSILRYRDLN